MWNSYKLSEISEIVTGNTPSTKIDAFYGGQIPFVKPPDLGNAEVESFTSFITELGKEKSKTAPKNSTLVCCIGSVGKTGITAEEVAFNQQINAIIPNININPLYVFFYTQTENFQTELKSKTNVTTLPIINKSAFSELSILVPTKSEQKNIAFILKILKQKIKILEKQIQHYEQLKQSLMEKVFREGLSNEALVETEVGLIPSNWGMNTISSLLIDKPKNGAFIKNPDIGTGLRYLNVTDIYKSEILNIDFLEKYNINIQNYKNFLVESGDVFFVRSSLKRDGIAICCVANKISEPTIFDCHLIKIKLNTSLVDPLFFTYYWNSTGHKELVARSKTTTMTTINQTNLVEGKMPLPSLKEQTDIVGILKKVDEKIILEEALYDRYTALFKTVLSKLMNQEIDVSSLEFKNA